MKILGVITARGGSKGIPGKNIKPIMGKPLITYTIEAAQQSGVFDRIILSTDDDGIAAVAKKYGCEVPFMRPSELAGDNTPHLPVMQHAVQWLKDNEHYSSEYTMILPPTAPLRQAFHIKEAVELMKKAKADSVLAVAEIPKQFTPFKAMVKGDDGFLKLITGASIWKRAIRRQDIPPSYWSVASLYLFRTELLFDPIEPNFYGDKVIPYVVGGEYVIDIDTPEDWVKVEKAMQSLSKQ
ncbi:MAG: acylneuraminate cytidylyltransferase family protein [Patescibacteria group bacterium]